SFDKSVGGVELLGYGATPDFVQCWAVSEPDDHAIAAHLRKLADKQLDLIIVNRIRMTETARLVVEIASRCLVFAKATASCSFGAPFRVGDMIEARGGSSPALAGVLLGSVS